MADIIQVLPDNVANQIAAGEVIQRPASVVKELVENAIDAGGTNIQIILKDAGRTLIQIADNGCGMSETDLRLAFERHATSKIKTAEDIFAIRTMGFRGEALASIAAIAQVECKTKQHENDLGSHIIINGSQFEKQESVACKNGTNFIIKNIFYNIPARRKFLKSNNTEFGHVLAEFNRIALANETIAFSLIHNDKEIFNLPGGNIKQRIINLFGKQHDKHLLTISSDTRLVKIGGFVGTPETAKKKNFDQYFFVNKRFMKHRSFYGAVMRSFENLIQSGSYPSFFIYLDIDPGDIDVNIHPTKTEIKFSDEYQISQIIEATIKEALGKFNIVPSLDFSDDTDYNDIFRKTGGEIKFPGIEIDTDYNPFESKSKSGTGAGSNRDHKNSIDTGNQDNWEKLYDGIRKNEQTAQIQFQTKASALNTNEGDIRPEEKKVDTGRFLQLKGRYILTTVKSGMMIIDQQRAHERILYEQYLELLTTQKAATQKNLFPLTLEVTPEEWTVVKDIRDELVVLGFDIEEFGKNSFVINGTPADMENLNIEEVLHGLIQEFRDNNENLRIDIKENIARSLARSSSIKYNRPLSVEEMQKLTDQLFACSSPNRSANGKKIIEIVGLEEIKKRF